MLKRISFLLLAAFLVGVAAQAAAPAIEGTIQKIDKNSITIQVGSEQKTFTLGRGFKFTVNGKHQHELALKLGDKVSIVADKKNTVKTVDVTPEAGAVAAAN